LGSSQYLYKIGDQEVDDDYAILLARLGGGKGVVSKHYILQGIKALLSKYRVDRFFEEYKPSQDTIESMISASGAQGNCMKNLFGNTTII
jgi:hypothetical protein